MTRRRQDGASFLFVVFILASIALILFAVSLLSRSTSETGRSSQTTARFAKADAALEQFVATAGRLPCPADPAADMGDAVPAAATVACTHPTGTIPWKTIGLSRDDSIDSWGRRISYRVFGGATGLTQADGASMVHCDTFQPGIDVALDAGGLCGTGHDNTESKFLAGKGLRLNDFGTVRTDVAYVLISHGPSGRGAYTPSGAPIAPPSSVDELANINTTTPATTFVARAASDPSLAPDAATHFDDLLAYQRIGDFIKRARLAGRDWPEPPPNLSATMTAAAVGAASGNGSSPPADLGRSQVTIGGMNIYGLRGWTGGGGGSGGFNFDDLSFGAIGGIGGIGVFNGGTGGNFLSSAADEYIGVVMPRRQRWFAVTLNHFGTYSSSGRNYTEQVEFTFFNGLGNTVATVRKAGCRADGDLASFTIDVPGGVYDIVTIRPIAATEPGGTTAASAMLVSDLAACLSAVNACQTSLQTAPNTCP